jgi:uncharacterized membrane protein YbhN (UPF0104 family)
VAFPHSGPAGISPAVRRFSLSSLRLAAGVTVLWFLGRQVGAAPFEDGLRAVTWQAVVAAVTLTALTTVCSAWRWRVVARALGVDISLAGAACAYYRSLFLNSVLPAGFSATCTGRSRTAGALETSRGGCARWRGNGCAVRSSRPW